MNAAEIWSIYIFAAAPKGFDESILHGQVFPECLFSSDSYSRYPIPYITDVYYAPIAFLVALEVRLGK